MTASSVVLIVVVAVVAILLIAVIAWVALDKRNLRRQVEAEMIRDDARTETLQVRQREAIADENAAIARAAQAVADVRAAHVVGLRHKAAAHRSNAASSREHLNEQLDRGHTMDPASQTAERRNRTQC